MSNDIGLQQLAKEIYNYCGINFLNNISLLQSKIANRLVELALSPWEYCGFLKMEKGEWDNLIQLITINETYFFREENLLKEFKDSILPQFKEYSLSNPLRIWSAACSTGEEPYTLSMLCEESKVFGASTVKIIASDIDKKVLSKAKKGVYNKKSFSFRKMPQEMLDKYFLHLEEEYAVKDIIKEKVEFKNINLFDSNLVEKMEEMDIIFCRNVLIYFDQETIKKIIHSFYNILKPGGYLLLGHAETITGMNTGFKAIYTDSTFYYRKEG
ncbi:protein-glutamate O-methyltransferase CheR [Clostridium sp. CX1]|uniref:CheR family methyltransferase n=1 Tax=Clostridium sp. CX1 TaxID=2978346 RepID=UPI0021BE9D2E|nr:protein-glutamate O-methyltransferase CheR [Clostridium sp. CX1]MCT8977423.1 protein-glutamate O-methyltransferase CheR [Clostridium sp. CX1]